MLISRINDLNASNQEFATARAAKALPTNSGGFSDYLARIMDAEYESFSEDAWASEYAAPGILADHSINQPNGQSSVASISGDVARQHESPHQDYSPAESGTETHKAAKPVADGRDGDAKSDRAGAEPVTGPDGQSDATKGTLKSDKSKNASADENHRSIENHSPKGHAIHVRSGKGHAEPRPGAGGAEPLLDTGPHGAQTAAQRDLPAVKSGEGAATRTGNVADIEVRLNTAAASAELASAEKTRIVDRVRQKPDAGQKVTDALRPDQDTKQKSTDSAARDPRIEVRDLRRGGARAAENHGRGSDRDQSPDGGNRAATTPASTATAATAGTEQQGGAAESFDAVVGRLAGSESGAARTAPAGLRTQTEAPVLHSLRQALSEQVNGEIVRAARFVVKGSDTGEIRLHLKPENLGSVRIALQMQEGHIAGRIIVENSSVREVFEQNLEGLIKAFGESGLETGTLDVTLADSGNGTEERADRSHMAQSIRELDRAVPVVGEFDDYHDLVDLVV